MKKRVSLAGKVAIVTGASSGIGAATAREFAKAGMRLVITARREDRLRALAKELEALAPRRASASTPDAGMVEVVVGDAVDPAMHARLLDVAERRFGGFDFVFANAGYGIEKGLLEMDPAALRHMFEVNFFSSIELLRLSARRLIDANRGGHLLLCSSALAKLSLPYFGVYAATKAAQAMVARSLRFELEPHGIEVSSVHPIATVTEFFDLAHPRASRPHGSTRVPLHAPRAFIQKPERVARAIVAVLRRPRSEVWTSHIVRLSSGLLTAFPFVADYVLRREARRTRTHAR